LTDKKFYPRYIFSDLPLPPSFRNQSYN